MHTACKDLSSDVKVSALQLRMEREEGEETLVRVVGGGGIIRGGCRVGKSNPSGLFKEEDVRHFVPREWVEGDCSRSVHHEGSELGEHAAQRRAA